MFNYPIDASGEFQIEDCRFHIDLTPGSNRRRSDENAFTIVKSKQFLDIYATLASTDTFRSILELGIFQGGSFVLIDKMFKPDRMAAVDISKTPVEPLVEYAARVPGRYLHFATSQDDEAMLDQIIRTELNNRLDFVVDDASHLYEFTTRSFEILFPRLEPGGVYVIEDWAWSHTPNHQPSGSTWTDRPALSNLIFELVSLLGSTNLIASIEIYRPLAIIRKSRAAPLSSETMDLASALALRGKQMVKI